MRKIPQQAVEYVAAHINEHPRAKIAEEAGISISKLYEVIHQLGGNIKRAPSKEEKMALERAVRELYPSMTANEIATKMGVTKSRVLRVANRVGVKHSEETNERILQENVRRMVVNGNNPECHAKRAAKFKRKRKAEIVRVMSGMKRETRMKLRLAPKKMWLAMNRLIRRYRYFRVESEPYTLYYDSMTTRHKMERRFTERYGISFLPYEEEEREEETESTTGTPMSSVPSR